MLWLLYPVHLMLAFFAMTFGLAAGIGWVVVLALTGELALALALAPLAPVARLVERREAQLLRRRQLSHMDADHRSDLQQLERAVEELRQLPGAAGAPLVDLDGLLETYARLAVACAESRQLMGRFPGAPTLDNSLRPTMLPAPSVRSDGATGGGGLRERRAELTALRVDSCRQARRDTEELELQLGIISDVVMLVHQQAIAATCRLHSRARAGELIQLACALRDGGDTAADAQAELEALAAD